MTMPTHAGLPVHVDPAHWLECLDGIALDTTLQRWVEQPRFCSRLIERLRRRHELIDLDQLPRRDSIDSALYALDADALALAIRTAGVIVHANAVSREIHAPRVAAIRQHLGADLYALALTHRDIDRGHLTDTDVAIGDDLDSFEARVEHDGRRCLLAWAGSQPAPLRTWLQLGWLGRLSADAAPGSTPGGEYEIVNGRENDDAPDDAGEIARLAATYLLSRSAASDPTDRQNGDS